jgi:hypothetical protein
LRNAKVKFSSFEKKDKFYNEKVLLSRFIHHLKLVSFKNVSNILSSFLNWGEQPIHSPVKRRKDDEDAQKRMLLGRKATK